MRRGLLLLTFLAALVVVAVATAQGPGSGRGGTRLKPGEECPPGTTEVRPGSCQAPEFPAPSILDYRPRSTLVTAEQGFAFARVRPRAVPDPAARTISLTYLVDEGPRIYIERINVNGNIRTKDYVILREFRLAEGDAYNPLLVDRAKKRLNGLGFDTKVTGVFNESTRSVIKRWQAARGYTTSGYLNKLQHKALLTEIVATTPTASSSDDDEPKPRRRANSGGGGGGGAPVQHRAPAHSGPDPAGAGRFIGGVMGGMLR